MLNSKHVGNKRQQHRKGRHGPKPPHLPQQFLAKAVNESQQARLQAVRILPNSILECLNGLNPPHISEKLLTFQLPYSSQVCSDPSKCLISCLLRQCHLCFLLHRNAVAQGKETILKTSIYTSSAARGGAGSFKKVMYI